MVCFVFKVFSFLLFFLLALAVFVRSPSAYEALKSFDVLHLPSRSTLQAYTGAFLHEAGASSESISHQVESYRLFCKSQEKLVPKADGVLVFDEVKVISSLIWNCQDHQIIGLAMTEPRKIKLPYMMYFGTSVMVIAHSKHLTSFNFYGET